MREAFESFAGSEWACDHATVPESRAKMMIGHDFANVLQVAISAVRVTRGRLLEADSALAATLADALDALDRASLLARKLTTTGRSPNSQTLVHIGAKVLGWRRLLQQAIGDRMTLETLISDGLAPVLCDDHRLQDALLNLAINARDAMSGEGLLLVEALPCSSKDHGPHCVTLTVADSGPGMSEDVAGRAFEPYFTTRRDRGGSGLGLHNVRAFVEELGGSVELHTSRTAGTRIRLHLPAVTAPPFEGAL
jgi:signal transduction histidine kinase